MSNECLIVFSRYPEPGKTKTRMIPVLGAKGAAELQRKMTEHTVANTKKLCLSRSVAIEVHFTGGNQQLMETWLGKELIYYAQTEGNLGQKMHSAIKQALIAGRKRVIIIGTDCPDLTQAIFHQAFNSLKDKDLVLGEAVDGGYYLIGLNRLIPELFQNINWGTETVFAQTKAIATNLGLSIEYLPVLADVDRPQDLSIWEKYSRLRK